MGRRTRVVVGLALLLLAAACGDPIVVLGDAPGLMRIIIGVGDSIGTRVDSLAARTRLLQPTGVVFDARTNLVYVGDRGALQQIGGAARQVARIFSINSRGRADLLLNSGGCQQGVCIEQVSALALGNDGSLIIADAVGHRVLRYQPLGQLTVLAGTGVAAFAPDGARANTSPMARPSGVAVTSDGSIYVTEAGANRLRAIAPDGTLRTVAGTGVAGSAGDGGAATAAQLNEPSGLLLDQGQLYIAEFSGHRVRMVDRAGNISTIAGTDIPGFSGDNGAATAAQLNRPYALAGGGRALYISDQGNDRVRVVDLLSGVIRTFAGTGDRRYTGSRRAAGETSLSAPFGLHAAAGFLFIADAGHSVVWRTSTAFE